MKIKIGKINFFIPSILIVFLSAFLVRIMLSPFLTLELDHNTFIAWSRKVYEEGFRSFYLSWCDYLPGYVYVLWFLAKIKTVFAIPDVLLYKLPAIISDILTGLVIYKAIKERGKKNLALVLSLLYVFNPAILSNSALWGQVDSLSSLFIMLTLYFAGKNIYISSLFLSLGTLIKPQVAFILPVLILWFIFKKYPWWKIFSFCLPGAILFLVAFVPFLPRDANFVNFVWERITQTTNQYPYGSVNAFNFWGLWGFWKTDVGKLPFYLVGIFINLLVIVGYVVNSLISKNKNFDLYKASLLVLFTSFLFLTRMHERHFLVIFAPVLVVMSEVPNLIVVYLFASLTYLANMFYSYKWISEDYREVFSPYFIKILISVNLLSFFYTSKEIFVKSKNDLLNKFLSFINRISDKKSEEGFLGVDISSKKAKIFLILILLFALTSRLLFLDSPKDEYFDEVYHAFTAKQMLHNNVAAWEWWNDPPEGFAYEWTHPPLAKLFMWGSMALFGESAFFWRLPAALLGTGIVYLVYLLAKALFKDELISIFSAFVFSLDGLALSMSRIGMNDTYLVFFGLLSIYFFIRKKDFLSALSFGLALSSKWSSAWCIPVLFVLFLERKKKIKASILWFLSLPPLVYLANYIPMFLSGHNLDIFWGMQKQMWWYHTRLVATHAYTSRWWSWPLNLRPVYLYTSDEINGWVSRIYNLGNPVVFWFGLVAVISIFIFLINSKIKKNKVNIPYKKSIAFVLFSYFAFFVPWSASPRIMFFYHYLPAVPFLSIATAYILRINKKMAPLYFITAFLIFVYFYPHWTGINIPLWLDKSYYWISSWR